MTDPRKPIHKSTGDDAAERRFRIHGMLLALTETGAKQFGCSGASFVTTCIGIWAQEFEEIDTGAVSKLFAALSVIYDPKANDRKKAYAEKKRAEAVKRLLHSVDLEMATEGQREN